MVEVNPKWEHRMSDEQQSADAAETAAEATKDADNGTITLPDDHPLVRTLAAQKEQLKELKSKAQRLDEIEESQKSEAQKVAESLSAAEERAKAAEARAEALEIATEFRLNKKQADILANITDSETRRLAAEEMAALQDDAGKPRQPKPDRNQGRQSGGTTSTSDQFAAAVGDLL